MEVAAMEARMCGPLGVRSPGLEEVSALALHGPPVLTLVQLGKYQPRQGLRKTVAELQQSHPALQGCNRAGVEEAWAWAQREQATGRLAELMADELAALRLCAAEDPCVFSHMNCALSTFRPGSGEIWPWDVLVGNLLSGLTKLRNSQRRQGSQPPSRLVRALSIPQEVWGQHIASRKGRELCFAALQSVTVSEPSSFLGETVSHEVACVFEFDKTIAALATNVEAVTGSQDEYFLPPYFWGVISEIEACSRAARQGPHEIFRVRVTGIRTVEPLPEALDSRVDSTLAGALLVGLHALSKTSASGALMDAVSDCFRGLAAATTVRSSEAVKAVWKSFWECLLEEVRTPKKIKESTYNGLIDVALVAAWDVAFAARGVTKRALGFESCMNWSAMEEELERHTIEVEKLKEEAVAVAREQVLGLQLETMTDPEAFIKFVQHDPLQAFEAAPLVMQTYVEAGAAQRVLLFAKLMGLIAMAAGLMEGEKRVTAAFNSPFPLRGAGNPGDAPGNSPAPMSAAKQSPSDAAPQGKMAVARLHEARKVVELIELQQLHLARARLLVVAGAPDVGKTTLLRETFGLDHLATGLAPGGRTDQVRLELHPDGNEQVCPVYLVDTPGYGDGELLHRNDHTRLLLGAGSWVPHGVVLVWVVRAGRNVRHEADDLLRGMVASGVSLLVVVTHVDRLFEERYREVGPQWRAGELQGVPHRDPRWRDRRRVLMAELREEVNAGVRTVIGAEADPKVLFTCLGGWMVATQGAEEEDEFAQAPPWPWARQEVIEFFGVLDRQALRRRLDATLGL